MKTTKKAIPHHAKLPSICEIIADGIKGPQSTEGRHEVLTITSREHNRPDHGIQSRATLRITALQAVQHATQFPSDHTCRTAGELLPR